MGADESARSRRDLLGAAIGVVGAAAIAATVPRGVAAADNDTALLGVTNESTNPTRFESTSTDDAAVVGIHQGAGVGARGVAGQGTGIKGQSPDATPSTFGTSSFRTGVYGESGPTSTAANTDEVGVYGYSGVSVNSVGAWGDSSSGTGLLGTGFTGVYAQGYNGAIGDAGSNGIGVYGYSGDEDLPEPARPGAGVYAKGEYGTIGEGSGTGVGVFGYSGTAGITFPATGGVGVYAKAGSTSQVALVVEGKLRMTRSKRVPIGASASSLKVTMAGVTTSSYVLATLQTSITGCYVRAVVPANGSFTIYLSKAPGKAATVAYMVIN